MPLTSHGHEDAVKILLGREEVDPDKPDDFGETSLSHAAWFGREGVVRILLMREEVNPGWPSNDGQTPLSDAAFRGCREVVRMLLLLVTGASSGFLKERYPHAIDIHCIKTEDDRRRPEDSPLSLELGEGCEKRGRTPSKAGKQSGA